MRIIGGKFKNKKIEVHKDSKRGWFHISDAIKAIENASLLKRSNSFTVFGISFVKPKHIIAHISFLYLTPKILRP